MEKTLMDEVIAGGSILLVGVLVFLMTIKWFIVQFLPQLSNLRYALQFFVLYSDVGSVNIDNQTKITTQKACTFKKVGVEENTKDLGDKKLCLGDLPLVMENLGSLYGDDESKEMVDLFEEEPSLEEVKEAFNLFDGNTDGFIDAGEIKKVLHVLGFVQASESECRRMIKAFDHNGDGRIDFEEFIKLMENSVC